MLRRTVAAIGEYGAVCACIPVSDHRPVQARVQRWWKAQHASHLPEDGQRVRESALAGDEVPVQVAEDGLEHNQRLRLRDEWP